MANWRVYSNNASNYLEHKSQYGSFTTVNGRTNNSSEYNHNYYMARKRKAGSTNSSGGKDVSSMSTKELISYSNEARARSSELYEDMSDMYDAMLASGVRETKTMARGEPITDTKRYFGSEKKAVEKYNESCYAYKEAYEENMAAQRELKKRGNNARDLVGNLVGR